jgi:hypothetical protein
MPTALESRQEANRFEIILIIIEKTRDIISFLVNIEINCHTYLIVGPVLLEKRDKRGLLPDRYLFASASVVADIDRE